MAKESRGQQVKTFTHGVPQADLSYEQEVVKVYFRPADGDFAIYLPQHIADMEGTITHSQINFAIAGYKACLSKYLEAIKTAVREKVITISFTHNIRYVKGFHDVRNSRNFAGYGANRGEIHFTGSPAIHLNYSVLHRAGKRLYNVTESDGKEFMSDAGTTEGKKVIPWTQEREDFFASTVNNIERLIMAMIEFMDDIEGNIDKAIASNGGQLLIGRPQPTA
jgi:hypothetical protein